MAKFKHYQGVINPVTNQKDYFEASSIYLLNNKIAKKKTIWKAQLEKHLEKLDTEATKLQCEKQNEELRVINNNYNHLLEIATAKNNIFDWKTLKDLDTFEILKPHLENYYAPILVTKLFGLIPLNKKQTEIKNSGNLQIAKDKLNSALNIWEGKKQEFNRKKEVQHESIDCLQNQYEQGDVEAIEFYHQVVFEGSEYPENIQLKYNLVYNPDSKILLIDLDLPKKKDINQIATFKYIIKDNNIDQTLLKDKQINDNYNTYIYKIILRTIYEVSQSDVKNHIELIVVNSWVDGIDPSTGHDFRNCIASIQVKKDEFVQIKLDR